MPGVFVSHAAADKPFVDVFMDEIIRLGCEVPKKQIFYTSGADTGIPSGSNLNSYVQQNVADASIVVAILTPSFQARPFCVAELGAAWSRTEKLFPIAAPGLARTDLQGVLTGLIVRYLDDSEALDELHEAVCAAAGPTPGARTWNTYKAKWQSKVNRLAAKLAVPRLITPEDYDRIKGEAQGARDALTELQDENDELKGQIEQLKVAKDAATVRKILKPKTEVAEFEALRDTAGKLLGNIPSPARDAVYWDMRGENMPWPNAYEDKWAFDEAEKARIEGWLVLSSDDEELRPNTEMGKVRRAVEAVAQLQKFMGSGDRTEDFTEWFEEEYEEMPLDLRNKALWEQVF